MALQQAVADADERRRHVVTRPRAGEAAAEAVADDRDAAARREASARPAHALAEQLLGLPQRSRQRQRPPLAAARLQPRWHRRRDPQFAVL